MLYPRLFPSYDRNQHYIRRKAGRTWGKFLNHLPIAVRDSHVWSESKQIYKLFIFKEDPRFQNFQLLTHKILGMDKLKQNGYSNSQWHHNE